MKHKGGIKIDPCWTLALGNIPVQLISTRCCLCRIMYIFSNTMIWVKDSHKDSDCEQVVRAL